MNHIFTALFLLAPATLSAQQPEVQANQIPIHPLAPPTSTSSELLGSIAGLKELPGNRLLVNDVRGHRLLVFDATLSTFGVTADSNGTGGKGYPRAAGARIYNYLGDSAILVDGTSNVLVVIGPDGALGRAMALVKPADAIGLIAINAGVPGFDAKARLIYRGWPRGRPAPPPGAAPPPPRTRDSIGIVRADFESRRLDTIASVSWPLQPPSVTTTGANGRSNTTSFINPLPGAPDDWAVLSDGAVAVVRGHDYHIDWVYADGTTASTPKMAFDWRRLTDDDKQAKLDSARRLVDSLATAGIHYFTSYPSRVDEDGRRVVDTLYPTVGYVPLKDIADYIPPIRLGALRPDADGNLWILPTTSAQASGGLLYDVVNQKGKVFERVQLPRDRDIAGFGRGGVVYLSRRVGNHQYVLERTKVVR